MFWRVIAAALIVAIGTPAPAAGSAIEPQCLDSLTAFAVTNDKEVALRPVLAEPLGLPANWPMLQAVVRTADGVAHVFAVDGTTWRDALLVATGGGQVDAFRIDRQGNLRGAIHAENDKVAVLKTNDPSVIARFAEEVRVWRSAKAEGSNVAACAAPTP